MRHLTKLRHFLRPYLWQTALALLALLGLTGASLAVPRIIQRVIDVGIMGSDLRLVGLAGLAITGIGVVRALLSFVERYLSEWISHKVAYDLRNQLYDRIQRLSFGYHDHAQTGQLMSRCTEDVSSIQRFSGVGLLDVINTLLLLVGIVTILLASNVRLALISLAPMVPLTLVTLRFGQRIGPLFLAIDNALGEISNRLQENLTGAQVVRAFAREHFEIERFDVSNRRLFDARLTVIGAWSRMLPTTQLLVMVSTALILWFGGQQVLAGTMTVGEVAAFNSFILLLAEPVQRLGWLVNLAGEAAAGLQRVYDVLSLQPEIQSPPGAASLPTLSGRVAFRDVSFAYKGEKRTLAHISFEAEPNQVIALIGPTGSGKTSVVNLIPRFYEVTAGAVLVDGVDVRRAELQSLRRQIGIVLQTSLLFSGSIRDNLAYGREDATEEEVVAAARAARAHDFIMQFPQGYDTLVGERGVTLSGGQRQRVAIARALLMDPRILILDDSTSSVDTQTEYLIQQALETLMQDRTTFVIAQRLSTVKRADLILVLDGGRIVQRGRHEALLAEGGLYRQIYDLQLKDQEQFRREMLFLAEGPPSGNGRENGKGVREAREIGG
ncbi:MAG: ABC transporter ATP-binding protein [Chloroflexi bacterium]|nr:ABC transporter ATP-binding protein [Chloroflexota bacterium]